MERYRAYIKINPTDPWNQVFPRNGKTDCFMSYTSAENALIRRMITMSYQIFYKPQFVRIACEKTIIPVFLQGSNNSYEVKTGMRSRSWCSSRLDKKLVLFPDELRDAVEREISGYITRCASDEWYRQSNYTPEQVQQQFGWFASLAVGSRHTSETSADHWRKIINKGIAGAKTVEELRSIGVAVAVETYPSPQKYVRTEEELYNTITNAYANNTTPFVIFPGQWRLVDDQLKRKTNAQHYKINQA